MPKSRESKMRVFTDGSCVGNGKSGAKAGWGAWFPENPAWSTSAKLDAAEPHTNQRAELSAIRGALDVLLSKGCTDEDIVIYTDSDYSINCLSKWITKWVARNWKTIDGKDVLHQDLIKDISTKLSKFKSHRFHHVRAHTGGEDDLSKNNDIVDRMARESVEDAPRPVALPAATDILFPGCPLSLFGSSVHQSAIVEWIRNNMTVLDADVVDKHLFKAFTEICKARDVNLVKQVVQKKNVIRAEVAHLQITRPDTDNTE
jgi:ribonuclease HI